MMYLASLDEDIKDKVTGYNFIHNREELDKVVADNRVANTIVIRGDFARTYFTPSGLRLYVEQARRININLNIELDGEDEIVTKKDLLYLISKCRDIDELMQLMVTYDKEFMDVMKELLNSREMNSSQILGYSNQISRLQQSVIDAQNQIEDLQLAVKQEQENKLQYQSRLSALVARINYQYGVGIDKSKLFVVKSHEYDKILYFKEVSRVQYTDTFLYYLKEILKVLYGMPTRMVAIEGYYATGRVDQYPNLACHHNLFEEDVLSGDILMLGMQPKLMEDILRNPSKISILIVLDRGGYEAPHILGEGIEYFYLASDVKDVPKDVPMSRIISYSEKTNFIGHIKDFDSMDHAQKIQKYSSSNLVKTIVKLVES